MVKKPRQKRKILFIFDRVFSQKIIYFFKLPTYPKFFFCSCYRKQTFFSLLNDFSLFVNSGGGWVLTRSCVKGRGESHLRTGLRCVWEQQHEVTAWTTLAGMLLG